MNDKLFLIPLISIVPILFVFLPSAESAPDQATETTQLLVLSQLIDLNTNIIALDADIDTNNIFSEANLQTFAIDGISDRFFVQIVNTTNNECQVFDKAFQTEKIITCLEPFLSLTTPQKETYNADFTLPWQSQNVVVVSVEIFVVNVKRVITSLPKIDLLFRA